MCLFCIGILKQLRNVFHKFHEVSKVGVRYVNDRYRYIPSVFFNLENHLESIREKQVIDSRETFFHCKSRKCKKNTSAKSFRVDSKKSNNFLSKEIFR